MRKMLNRCRAPLLLASGTAPVAILLACGSGTEWLMLWPVAFLAAACAVSLLKGKPRLLAALLLAAVMAAACFLSFRQTNRAEALFAGVGYTALLLAIAPVRSMLTFTAVFSGGVIHALCQIFLNVMTPQLREEVYGGASLPMTASLLLFLAVGMTALNTLSLRAALPEGAPLPETIRRRNRLLTWLLLVFAVLVSLLPAVARLLEKGWALLRNAVAAAVRWLLSILPPQQAPAGEGGPGGGFGGFGEAAEPSTVALWLEKVILVLTALLAAAALVWLARKAWQKLLLLLKWLFQRLQRYAASATAGDYVDEMQDTRTQGEEGRARPVRGRRLSARQLASLPPRERIRRRYAQALRRHPEWPQSHTARQTLSGESASLYEKARYSPHEVSEAEADRFRP